MSGRDDQALENYRDMQSVARQRRDPTMELGALVSMATIHAIPSATYDPERAEQLADRAIALARELGDRASESRILWILLILNRWTEHLADSVRYGEQSLAIARQDNLREQMAFTLNDLAVHGYYNTGEFHKAIVVATEARELWREMNNLPMLADNYSSSGIVNYSLGNFDAVIADTNEALKISQSIDNLWGQSYAQWILGDVYSDRGEPDCAIPVMENSIRMGEQANFVGAQVGVRNLLAVTCGHYGLFVRGIQTAQSSVAIAEKRFPAWLAWSTSTLARLYVRSGQIGQAEGAMNRVHMERTEDYINRVMGHIAFHRTLAQAEIALVKNEYAQAQSVLDPLIDKLSRTNARAMLPEALYAKSKVALALHQIDAAHHALTQAREIAESLTARRTLWQIYAALSDIQAQRGNDSAAQSLRQQAREIINYISAHATDEMRAAFLSLPDVHAITVD